MWDGYLGGGWWKRCQQMRLQRQVGARPGGMFGLYLKADSERVKVSNQRKGVDISVIYNTTLAAE